MSDLLGGAVGHLEAAMRFRMLRQGALAANVVNADTPRYRRVDFEPLLAQAGSRLQRTHERHLPAGNEAGYRIVRGPRGSRPDGNGVELEREVVELTRNAGAFREQAAVLARLLALRRVAVTGEPR
jgi:flagellar basal-body rod protein FlgB